MPDQIKVLGTLKGVSLKSKVDDRGDSIHHIDLKLELIEGADKIQDIVNHLKSMMMITLESKQPSLMSAVRNPYKDDNEPEE